MVTESFKRQQRDYLEERKAAHARLTQTLAAADEGDLTALRKRMSMVERQIALAVLVIAHYTSIAP